MREGILEEIFGKISSIILVYIYWYIFVSGNVQKILSIILVYIYKEMFKIKLHVCTSQGKCHGKCSRKFSSLQIPSYLIMIWRWNHCRKVYPNQSLHQSYFLKLLIQGFKVIRTLKEEKPRSSRHRHKRPVRCFFWRVLGVVKHMALLKGPKITKSMYICYVYMCFL